MIEEAIARTIIGTTFDGADLLAYIVGVVVLLAPEKSFGRYKRE